VLIELTCKAWDSIIKQWTALKDRTTAHVISLLYMCGIKPSSGNCTGTWSNHRMQTQISFTSIPQKQSGQYWRRVLQASPCHLCVMSPTATEKKNIQKLSADSMNVHEPLQWRKCLPVSKLFLCHNHSQPSRWGLLVISKALNFVFFYFSSFCEFWRTKRAFYSSPYQFWIAPCMTVAAISPETIV